MENYDIVMPYRKSKTDELRYCLRSLKNIPHRHVFICGDVPDFVSSEVICLPQLLKGSTAQYDCELNLRQALLDSRLSDEFIFFNDDFFVMHKIDELPCYHAGEIDEVVKARKDPMFMKHNRQLLNTKEFLQDKEKYSYELHIPVIMNKKLRLGVSDMIMPTLQAGKVVLPRSIYFNMFCDISILKQDVKVYKADDEPHSDTFLSTLEPAFNGLTGTMIRNKFKERCKYEVTD